MAQFITKVIIKLYDTQERKKKFLRNVSTTNGKSTK